MAAGLSGLKILVPETRELDLFTSMLEAEGAQVLRCPLVRILDLEDTVPAEAWIERLIAGEFDDVIWLTGEGLRRLLAIADRGQRRDQFVNALARIRHITRGPKPARALREVGYASAIAAVIPTSQGVIEALATENIAGRNIGVQLYPAESELPLLAILHERGAVLSPVTPYRYASEADADLVADAIRDMADGNIQMVAFTSSAQVDRLIEIARGMNLEDILRAALAKITVAAVGPVVEAHLRSHRVENVLRPESSFHLKPFVRAITKFWNEM